MLDVLSKLELIEMCRKVEACSGLVGNIQFAHLELCRQVGVLESKEYSPALSLAYVKLGQVSSVS